MTHTTRQGRSTPLVDTTVPPASSTGRRHRRRLGAVSLLGAVAAVGLRGRLRPQAADGTVTGGLLRRMWVAAAVLFCRRRRPLGRRPDHRYRIEYLVPTCAGGVCFFVVAEYLADLITIGL